MFQTRNSAGAINEHMTLDDAFLAAQKDRTIWKISFNAENGERVRLITRDSGFTWIYESIFDNTGIEMLSNIYK